MIFIKFNNDNKAELIHYMPFDNKHGLHKTEEELLQEGVLLDQLPIKPEEIFGKDLLLFNNPLRWEYADRPLTREEKLKQLVLDGKITQEEMNELL